jgi:hypothetical protein
MILAALGEDLLKHEDLDSKDKAFIRFFLNHAFDHRVPILLAICSPAIALGLAIGDTSEPEKNDGSDTDCLMCVFFHLVARNYMKMAPIATCITFIIIGLTLFLSHRFRIIKNIMLKWRGNSVTQIENKISHIATI